MATSVKRVRPFLNGYLLLTEAENLYRAVLLYIWCWVKDLYWQEWVIPFLSTQSTSFLRFFWLTVVRSKLARDLKGEKDKI